MDISLDQTLENRYLYLLIFNYFAKFIRFFFEVLMHSDSIIKLIGFEVKFDFCLRF